VVLNEIGQLLFPLVGITRTKLQEIYDNIISIGLQDNKVAILADTEIDLGETYEPSMKYLYLLKPLKRYKKDFNRLLEGDYYGISQEAESIILMNLNETKGTWKGIFRNSEKTIKKVLENKLGKDNKNINHICKLIQESSIETFKAYKPLKELNLIISDDRNQLEIPFENW